MTASAELFMCNYSNFCPSDPKPYKSILTFWFHCYLCLSISNRPLQRKPENESFRDVRFIKYLHFLEISLRFYGSANPLPAAKMLSESPALNRTATGVLTWENCFVLCVFYATTINLTVCTFFFKCGFELRVVKQSQLCIIFTLASTLFALICFSHE